MQVFSDAPEVELFVNGKSLGKQQNQPFNFSHFANVQYAPGNLTAVGSSPHWPQADWPVHTLLTAGPSAAIVLSLDAPSKLTGTGESLLLDGHDAALVRATVVDEKGLPVRTASPRISFTVSSGPGRVAGVHNGDAKSHEHQATSTRVAYHGLCRAIVKVTVDSSSQGRDLLATIDAEAGDGINTVAVSSDSVTDIVVTATSPGLAPGKIHIPTSSDALQHAPLAAARHSAVSGNTLTFD